MPADAVAAQRSRERRHIPGAVIESARRNFLRYGVNRTTMTDVARDVGVTRQGLYEHVSSRDDLVDAVLVARIKEIAEDLKPLASEGVSFIDALIDTSVGAVQRAREDDELMNIVATGPADRIQDVITGDYPEVHEIVANLLGPILDRGIATGMLRTDKSRDELVDWIRVVYLVLINQPGGIRRDDRDTVASFLLPSIMFSPNDKR